MDRDELIAQRTALDAQIAQADAKADAVAHLSGATEHEKDDGLLRIVGAAMEKRLADARAAGKAGWHADDTSDDALKAAHAKNVAKGDFLDAAIYAAMLHARQLLK